MTAPSPFINYLDRLATVARSSPDVVGLVGFGSTAAHGRADQWSDHDFAWLTQPGRADHYREDLSWLPDADAIALSVVEHHGGVKVIFTNGHRLEFGIADVDSFATWAGAPADVIVGDEAVRGATHAVVANRPEGDVDASREVRLMLTQIHSGVGRSRRGELLSASGLVRYEAVNHFARAVAARLAAEHDQLDPLDPRRRFDSAYPELGARLERIVASAVETAARELIDLAEEQFAPGWADFPSEGVAAVRRHFEWA